MTPTEFKALRRALGISSRALALMLSDRDEDGKRLNPRTIRRWEDPRGTGPPSPAVVAIRFLAGYIEAHWDEDGRLLALVNLEHNNQSPAPKATDH